MNDSPLVSVIMPVYNAQKYVAEALEGLLNQTYKNIEIICINDGSTDGSLEVLQSYGDAIVLINSEKNEGIAATRNKGIAVAQGEFLAFADADDVSEPERVEAQIASFTADATLDISFTHMQCFISPDLLDEAKKLRYCPPGVMSGRTSGTVMIKTESFKKVGMFNPVWRVGEFIDWFSRAEAMGLTFAVIAGVFVRRRIHETNTGVVERPSQSDYLKIMRESLKRKKQQ